MAFTPMSRFWLFTMLAVVGIAFSVLIAFRYTHSATYSDPSVAFYSNVLSSEHIDTEVSVKGVIYHLRQGVVFGADNQKLSDKEALPSLQLAFAQTVTQRSPQIALPGVDLENMESVVAELAAIEKRLSAAQTVGSDAPAITSLYPIQFLSTLPSLERARQQFILTGSDVDLAFYEERLQKSLSAQLQDVGAFQTSLARYITTPFSMPGFGGAITSAALSAGVSRIKEQNTAAQTLFASRKLCFKGQVDHCNSKDAEMPVISDMVASSQLSPAAQTQVASIASLLDEAFEASTTRTIVLSSSSCLGALPGPYAFADHPRKPGIKTMFIGDLYFTPINDTTEKDSPYLTYLAHKYDMTLLFANPMMYYMCPAVGNDIGRIRALEKIKTFAAAHPTIAPAKAAVFLNASEIREDYAIDYLRAALSQANAASSQEDRAMLTDLALMYQNRSVGVEEVIRSIADTNSYHATLALQKNSLRYVSEASVYHPQRISNALSFIRSTSKRFCFESGNRYSQRKPYLKKLRLIQQAAILPVERRAYSCDAKFQINRNRFIKPSIENPDQ